MEIQSLYSHFLRSTGVTTDSRSCPAGSIFFALHGERFDGNAYARQALEAGCALAVIDNPDYLEADDSRMVLVPDTLQALQALARHHRRQLGTPIVGVTGTNGKTTTKELLHAVLSKRYRTHCTRGNLNNSIGVPLTLLQLTADHEMAVVEMGASHPGDIRELVEIAEPDCGLITNVGRAHLQGFGSFEGVIRTKGELYDFLRTKDGSVVFIHDDNPHLRAIADGLQLVRYGSNDTDGRLSVWGTVTACNPFLQFRWRAEDGAEHDVATQLVGSYNLDNALAAICVGRHFGVPAADIDAAIAAYTPSNSRSQLLRTERNTLIVDAYNANPTSMAAALQGFARMDAEHKWVIVGDMKELGDASAEEHRAIVRLLSDSGFQRVWLVGTSFADAYAASGSQTADAGIFRLFPDADAVAQQLQAELAEGYTVLIKGSNSMKLAPLSKLL